MNIEQVEELVLQALEHEYGGKKIYETAIKCALNADLKKEWTKYSKETKEHASTLEGVCRAMGIDVEKETPGRAIVRHNGKGLLEAMTMAIAAGNPAEAELVACDVVVLAETKDHANWQLLTKCSQYFSGPGADELKAATDEVEDQEDEHLYHTKGWCRELWLQSLGLNAVLPPPEERLKVTTAIGAAKAEASAEKLR